MSRSLVGTLAERTSDRKGIDMTNTQNDKPNENHGNETTVHNPKAPGQVEKVDPTTGDTTTESTNPVKPAKR